MFRRFVMSHGRRLMTASSREHQTNLKSYLNRTPPQPLTPLTPFSQLLVFRSLSTVSPPNHEEDGKGKDSKAASEDSSSSSVETNSKSSSSVETDSWSFEEWMNNIYEGQLLELLGILVTLRFAFLFGKWVKKNYDDKKHIKRDESVDGCLKYEISGFKGAYDKSITAEIRNSRYLVVSGRTYNSYGRSVVIERHITLPNHDYSEANNKATFYPNVGIVVVDISDYKKIEDIKIQVEETKD